MNRPDDTAYRADALIDEDIGAYLESHRDKDMLRFITCGSVDDGKSTLIGRLLYDTKLIFEDQLASLESDSAKHGTTGADIDFALLVDGLESELVRLAVADTRTNSGAAENRGEAERVVVASLRSLLEHRHTAELGSKNHQCAIQQAALFQVPQQSSYRLIQYLSVHLVLRLKLRMTVPI